MPNYKCIICQEIVYRLPEQAPADVQYIRCPFGGEGANKCNLKEKRTDCGLCRTDTKTGTSQAGQGPLGGTTGSP